MIIVPKQSNTLKETLLRFYLIWIKATNVTLRPSVRMEHIKKLANVGLFTRNVPRYTSYPTAPQFHNGVGGKVFEGWIKALPDNSKLSIYIHIPFCERLCWFCACRTQGVRTLSPVDAYLKVLKREISKLAETVPAGVSIAKLHWGGGSPTILQPEHIESLMESLHEIAPFDPDIEFSVEIDPASINDAKLDALANAGMNRASIGIQDFNPEVQAAIGRVQSYEMTRGVIEGLRKRGITSINADIVYGLPLQTSESFAETVRKVIDLGPDRVALFGYAHVPWMAKRQNMIDEKTLPEPDDRFALFNQARDMFKDAGYVSLGIDHFAKPTDSLAIAASNNRMRRNFQGYTDDTCVALVGLGASSISKFPQGYAQNRATTNTYSADIEAGSWATTKGIAVSLEDRIRSKAIENLMCEFKIDLAKLREEFGDLASVISSDLSKIYNQYRGFVSFDGTILVIEEAGFHLTRMIANVLDAYASASAQHSNAI